MSANLDDCLKYVFGLSRTPCECNEDDKPIDFDSSDSGIYLDELPGLNLNMINGARDCSASSIWQKMISARDQAVKDFKEDLTRCLVTRATLKRRPYSGTIGQFTKFSKPLVITNTYAGIKFRLADIVGGFARIKKIGMLFHATGSFDLTLYNNIEQDPIQTFSSVATTADKITWLTLSDAVQLDMNSQYSSYLEYYLIYQVNGANQPMDMFTHCGSCGSSFKPSWNENYPQYNSFNDKGNHGWADWSMITGIRGNDLSIINSWSSFNYLHGLALDVQFGCKIEKTICNESLDYESNPFALAMAYAIRFKAGAILLKDIMTQSEPNYYSVLAAELMPIMRNDFLKEYNLRVFDFICEEMTDPSKINTYSDCFTCKEEASFMKGKILV